MSYGSSSPIHKVGIIWMWKHAPILLWLLRRILSGRLLLRSHGLYLICQELLLFLLPSFFLSNTLTPTTIVNEEGQGGGERKDDKRFDDLRVDIVVPVVSIASRHSIVVICLPFLQIPSGQFGF